MEINGLSSAAMGGGRSANGVQQGMGQDEFLRLLMTQLQQQDPLNPMDNTELSPSSQTSRAGAAAEHVHRHGAPRVQPGGEHERPMVSFIGKDVDVSSAEVMLGETERPSASTSPRTPKSPRSW